MRGGKRKEPVAANKPPSPRNSFPLQLEQAFALLKAGRLTEADGAYSALIAEHPGLAIAHNHLGLIAKAMGQIDRAEALSRRAVELDPKDISGHTNLGNLLSKLGRYADADVCYARTLELAPDNEDGLLNRGGRGTTSAMVRARSAFISAQPRYIQPRRAPTMVSGSPTRWSVISPRPRRPIGKQSPSIRDLAAR